MKKFLKKKVPERKLDKTTQAVHRAERSISRILDHLERNQEIRIRTIDVCDATAKIVWDGGDQFAVGGWGHPTRKKDH